MTIQNNLLTTHNGSRDILRHKKC